METIMVDDNKVVKLVAAINAAHNADYEVVSKMPVGTHGAWTVLNRTTGVKQVLKLVSEKDTTDHVRLTGMCAGLVNNGSRTAAYELVGYIAGLGSFYFQELLPGSPATKPTHELVRQMIALNARQAGKGLGQGLNHTEKVWNIMFEDGRDWEGRDWLNKVAAFSTEGESLVADVRRLVEPHRAFHGRTDDIVHGDYQHYNALVDENDRLVGYVDWDIAGYGDRAIDLARLLYDVYVAELECGLAPSQDIISMLAGSIRGMSGAAGLRVYMAFWLTQVAEWGTRRFPEDGGKFFATGRRIIRDLSV
jgi:hypothetical protein